jgi:phosphoribosyl 1,2-cyclic phosphate phosphodiesterase
MRSLGRGVIIGRRALRSARPACGQTSMEIKLLGTSSAEGWPGLFCSCDICARSRKVGGKNFRTRTSALLDGVVKIDLPPDTLQHVHAHGLDMTKIESLVFTHAHDDHLAAAELQYLSWMFVPEGKVKPLRILGSKSVLDKIRRTVDMEDVPLIFCCLEAWEEVDSGGCTVTPIVPHHDPSQICFNLLVKRKGKTLLYATDTGRYDEPTWIFLQTTKIDGAVIECSKGSKEGGYEGHLSIEDVIEMRRRLDIGAMSETAPVVTTHMCHLGGLMHEEMEEIFKPHRIQVGFDGMVFEV